MKFSIRLLFLFLRLLHACCYTLCFVNQLSKVHSAEPLKWDFVTEIMKNFAGHLIILIIKTNSWKCISSLRVYTRFGEFKPLINMKADLHNYYESSIVKIHFSRIKLSFVYKTPSFKRILIFEKTYKVEIAAGTGPKCLIHSRCKHAKFMQNSSTRTYTKMVTHIELTF